MNRLPLALASMLACMPLLASAGPIVPLSYVFDQAADNGTWVYQDEGGRQLIDGVYGREGFGVNLGNGIAYEWVGWYQNPIVNIDFQFGAVRHIDQVIVGTTQDSTTDVVLPSLDVSYWNGSSWVLVQSLNVPESAANNRSYLSTNPHGFLTLSGLNITAQQVRVTARHSADGPWTFIDEVSFNGTAVPEPSSAALVALALAGVVTLRRRAA